MTMARTFSKLVAAAALALPAVQVVEYQGPGVEALSIRKRIGMFRDLRADISKIKNWRAEAHDDKVEALYPTNIDRVNLVDSEALRQNRLRQRSPHHPDPRSSENGIIDLTEENNFHKHNGKPIWTVSVRSNIYQSFGRFFADASYEKLEWLVNYVNVLNEGIAQDSRSSSALRLVPGVLKEIFQGITISDAEKKNNGAVLDQLDCLRDLGYLNVKEHTCLSSLLRGEELM